MSFIIVNAARKRADREFNGVVLEVLCRVFDDGADQGMEEWREWYKPEQWISARRALGGFIRQRLDRLGHERKS